jgi:hypothetical protein
VSGRRIRPGILVRRAPGYFGPIGIVVGTGDYQTFNEKSWADVYFFADAPIERILTVRLVEVMVAEPRIRGLA